jgi:hypothetical protein
MNALREFVAVLEQPAQTLAVLALITVRDGQKVETLSFKESLQWSTVEHVTAEVVDLRDGDGIRTQLYFSPAPAWSYSNGVATESNFVTGTNGRVSGQVVVYRVGKK